MHFKVGDFVIHPIYGLGHITKIEEKQFSEKETRLYYKITLPSRTIWLPTEARTMIGLRSVTAKSELDHYRNILKSCPTPLNDTNIRQPMELAARLKEGSFQVMCEIVRDLTLLSRQKTLGRTDNDTLKKARERLLEEWSAAEGVSVAEATIEVESLLQTAQEVSEG
jgi:CarD family transcriptional regulator